MPHEKLTAAKVEKLEAQAGKSRSLYFDTDRAAPRGFCLRVTAAGDRSYYLARRVRGLQRMVFARIDAVGAISLDEARAQAEALAGKMAAGVDVNVERRERRLEAEAVRAKELRTASEPTVAELVASYIKTRQHIAPKTLREYKRTADVDIAKSALGRMKARDAMQEDVRRFVHAVAKRGKFQADRALHLVRASFKWGQDEEVERGVFLVDRNPARGIDWQTTKVERVRRRTLVDVKASDDQEAFAEVVRFWRGTTTMKPVPRAFVRLLLLLGTRTGETAAARWGDVQFDGDAPSWHIPAERRKVKRSVLDPEVHDLDVPLAPLAVRILREIREREPHGDRDLVFAHLGLGFVGQTVKTHTEIADLRLHDLKRTLGTALKRLGAPPHILTLALGHREHAEAKSDEHYTHGARTRELREWLTKWAATVEALLDEKVVSIGKRGKRA